VVNTARNVLDACSKKKLLTSRRFSIQEDQVTLCTKSIYPFFFQKFENLEKQKLHSDCLMPSVTTILVQFSARTFLYDVASWRTGVAWSQGFVTHTSTLHPSVDLCGLPMSYIQSEINLINSSLEPITVVARSKTWIVFSLSKTLVLGSNSTRDMDVCLVCSVFVLYCV
jgi:hypothetical protein